MPRRYMREWRQSSTILDLGKKGSNRMMEEILL
jgi:hypothetical protein